MTIVAGWYPDPRDPTALRWFDGKAWTSRTVPVPASAVADASASVRTGVQTQTKRSREAVWAVPLLIGTIALSGGMLYFNYVAPDLIADQHRELYGISQRLDALRQDNSDSRSHLEELNRHREALR